MGEGEQRREQVQAHYQTQDHEQMRAQAQDKEQVKAPVHLINQQWYLILLYIIDAPRLLESRCFNCFPFLSASWLLTL